MSFARGGSSPPAEVATLGRSLSSMQASEGTDAVCCIVVEHTSVSSNDCFAGPDCLGCVLGGKSL